MIHGSLCSGLGGFDYAAEMIGWENAFHVEINNFCRTILKYYWPHAKSYTDIFEFDGSEWRGKIDIITAGFPCQPFSHAGKRKGSKDDRFIWPEIIRVCREIAPAFIVAENVPGLLTIESGMVFEQVCLDLEAEGYEVTPIIIPACAKDAVHRRDRIWIVAYSECNGHNGCKKRNCIIEGETKSGCIQSEGCIGLSATLQSNAANSAEQRLEGNAGAKLFERSNGFAGYNTKESWFEAATRLCSVDDELAGRVDTKTISKSRWRTESLKAYGNAIYWPIALEIFKAIALAE